MTMPGRSVTGSRTRGTTYAQPGATARMRVSRPECPLRGLSSQVHLCRRPRARRSQVTSSAWLAIAVDAGDRCGGGKRVSTECRSHSGGAEVGRSLRGALRAREALPARCAAFWGASFSKTRSRCWSRSRWRIAAPTKPRRFARRAGEGKWSRRDSNPRPPRCERGALPTELLPQIRCAARRDQCRAATSRKYGRNLAARSGRFKAYSMLACR